MNLSLLNKALKDSIDQPLTLDELQACAKKIASQNLEKPYALGLKGDLGAGKTTFAQAFIHVFDPKATVISPTFSLVQYYAHNQIAHYDLYRIKHPQEFYDLDIYEDLNNKICLIEWPHILDITIPILEITILTHTLRKIHIQIPQKD